MATMDDINSVLKGMAAQVGQVTEAIRNLITFSTTTADTATGGSATLPANPVGFLILQDPVTGVVRKIPYYNN